MDVLMHDTPQDIHLLQQEDLTQFGRLIFALCCGNPGASVGPHFQKSIDHIMRFYGQDMKSLALWLISKATVKVGECTMSGGSLLIELVRASIAYWTAFGIAFCRSRRTR